MGMFHEHIAVTVPHCYCLKFPPNKCLHCKTLLAPAVSMLFEVDGLLSVAAAAATAAAVGLMAGL